LSTSFFAMNSINSFINPLLFRDGNTINKFLIA
jgi:hypothetical protein